MERGAQIGMRSQRILSVARAKLFRTLAPTVTVAVGILALASCSKAYPALIVNRCDGPVTVTLYYLPDKPADDTGTHKTVTAKPGEQRVERAFAMLGKARRATARYTVIVSRSPTDRRIVRVAYSDKKPIPVLIGAPDCP